MVVNNDLFDQNVPNCLTHGAAADLFDGMQSDRGPEDAVIHKYYCDQCSRSRGRNWPGA